MYYKHNYFQGEDTNSIEMFRYRIEF